MRFSSKVVLLDAHAAIGFASRPKTLATSIRIDDVIFFPADGRTKKFSFRRN
jgi:hypothetical protein